MSEILLSDKEKLREMKFNLMFESMEIMNGLNTHNKRLLKELENRDLSDIETADLIRIINDLNRTIIQASVMASKGGNNG